MLDSNQQAFIRFKKLNKITADKLKCSHSQSF